MRKRSRVYEGLIASLVSPLVLFVTSPLIARILGPEGRGQMAYVLTVLVLLDYIALGGAINYLLVEAKTDAEFSQKILGISQHLRKTTLIASIFSVVLATKYLSAGVGTFCFLLILLSSFRNAKKIELKKVSAIIKSDWKTLNRERIFIPIVRLLLTFTAYFLHITDPLIFVAVQVLAGVAVSQFLFRKYSVPKDRDPRKSSNLDSQINSYFVWSIFENVGYWGVNLLIGVLIPAYEFGILAIALVAGEVILTLEKFTIKYQTTLHIEELSNSSTTVQERKPYSYKSSLLPVAIYAVVVYFSIPIVFGYAYSSSVIPSLFCICAGYLRLLLRSQNYTVAQQRKKHPSVIAEFSIVVSGVLFCFLLLLYPNAFVGSVIIFASVLVGFSFSIVARRRFL